MNSGRNWRHGKWIATMPVQTSAINHFAQFGYDMTYEEILEHFGIPNGMICTSSSCLPYYELNDGRFAVCGYDLKNLSI